LRSSSTRQRNDVQSPTRPSDVRETVVEALRDVVTVRFEQVVAAAAGERT
jgi:hypothetical protein